MVTIPTIPIGPGWTKPGDHSVKPKSASHEQLALFLPRIHTILPNGKDSKDLLDIGIADDGNTYFLKNDRENKSVMASEWIATKIAAHIGISVPECCPVQTPDEQIVFGSRLIAGVSDETETQAYLTTPTLNELGGESFPGSFLSMVLVLDLFLNNGDRHFNNYVSVADGGSRRLYAIDFGRSLFWDWPLNKFPLNTDNTEKVRRQLFGLHRFDLEAAKSVASAISNISVSFIRQTIAEMPESWLTRELTEQFLTFWDGNAKRQRINEIKIKLTI